MTAADGDPPGRVRQMLADVNALGVAAPLRAAYEVSKRVGGHRVVFGSLRRRSKPAGPARGFVLRVGDVPGEALARARIAAERIAAGRVRVFGSDVDIGPSPQWHRSLVNGDSWPQENWWQVDIRSDDRQADVKWAWEVGRSRHLAILARAASTLCDERAATALVEQLRSWLAQNPLEIGVHWYSNLEISLRSLVWLEVLGRAGPTLPIDVREGLSEQLWHAGWHVLLDQPYTLTTMRNNHLLGDGLGLQAIGRAFPGVRRAHVWERTGAALFASQARRHFRPDGSMVEDSLSYHRFVLEMLTMRRVLSEQDSALVSSAQFLSRLGALDGPVPQYGDWDEGRVLVTTQDPTDVAGSVRAALAAAGEGAPAAWRAAHDECAWYVAEGAPVEPEPAERDGNDIGGGWARAARGRFVVWLKAGSGPSHGHADLCSTPILYDGQWIVGDPGTGTYNGPIEQRNYFRSSRSHNVLRLEALDQLEPHRAFRWRHSAFGAVGPPQRLGGAVVMWGYHDAYRRLTPARRVVRAVVATGSSVMVADWVDGPAGIPFALSLPLGPGVAWTPDVLALGDATSLRLATVVPPVTVRGQESPFDGWWSPTYGSMEPSQRLELRGRVEGPVWWALAPRDEPVHVDVDAEGLVWNGVRARIDWHDGAVGLHVSSEGEERHATLRTSRG